MTINLFSQCWLLDSRADISFLWNVSQIISKRLSKMIDVFSFLVKVKSIFNSVNLDSSPGPLPLANIGLNCYLNSAFQAISACPKFISQMKILQGKFDCCIKLKLFNHILTSISKPQDYANYSGPLDLSTNQILSKWNMPGEQDTFELISHVLHQVHDELKSIFIREHFGLNKSEIDEKWNNYELPMKLQFNFQITCECGHSLKTCKQSDIAIHLPIPFKIYKNNSAVQLQDLLDNYFIRENITEYDCAMKHTINLPNRQIQHNNASKFVILEAPPPSTLCLHIQRSYWHPQLGDMVKNNERVDFSEKIILRNYYFADVSKLRDSKNNTLLDLISTNGLENVTSINTELVASVDKIDFIDIEYYLKSVIVHFGAAHTGHYICYRLLGDQWFCLNDSYVNKVSLREVLQSQAYILMYEQI